MTISTNCAYNNQTHCNIKNLYCNKHKHMVNHICWNPSFFPLPNADIHEISNFYQKRHLFIKNYSFFIKNLIDPPYKKLQPQISPFIKNSIFGNNRDPCCVVIAVIQDISNSALSFHLSTLWWSVFFWPTHHSPYIPIVRMRVICCKSSCQKSVTNHNPV